MSSQAVILSNGANTAGPRLVRLLEFLGVRCRSLAPSELAALPKGDDRAHSYAIVASLEAYAAAMTSSDAASAVARAAAVYLYPTTDRGASERALRQFERWETASLQPAGAGPCSVSVSADLGDFGGPMAGITVAAQPRPEDFVIAGDGGHSSFSTLLSVAGSPSFVRFTHRGVVMFLCTSAAMVDIDEPVSGPYFDIKEHFCSLVPLAMFATWAFRDSMWRPLETGACFIVDDPLLKSTYGFCDFNSLLTLMNRYDFTTNVAFIPWNWRRTSSSAAEFFKRESRRYSISIHGCDHTSSEFGDTSIEWLDSKARLAQSRMRKHEARTGIVHDRVMVFPQGVFSSQTPGVLKRTGFGAAVNTEVKPVDAGGDRTLIRDVWDVAIRRYTSFPIFTRRYAFHGVENFAFDILIGKPCLIVAHHDFFKKGYGELTDLLGRLRALKCSLTWRSLGGVIRRAGRRRRLDDGSEEIEMYGDELIVPNPSTEPLRVVVKKMEEDASLVSRVRESRSALAWSVIGDSLVFKETIDPASEARFIVEYHEPPVRARAKRTLGLEATVAARRLLSEFRDEYWQKVRSAIRG